MPTREIRAAPIVIDHAERRAAAVGSVRIVTGMRTDVDRYTERLCELPLQCQRGVSAALIVVIEKSMCVIG